MTRMEEALREWAADPKVSQREASEKLGISKTQVQKRCAALGLRWVSADGWARKQRIGRNARRRVDVNGRSMGLLEAARLYGLDPHLVDVRWYAGDRTAKRLLRPAGAPRQYEIGLSVADWQVILEYVQAKGLHATSKKFGVPTGAIRLVQEGRWEAVS